MSGPRLDALVLNLETRAGLAAARSLGRSGYRIGAATWGRRAPGLRTRFAEERAVFPSPAHGGDACARALIAWLAEHPTDAVLTSTDTGLTILHEHRDEISRYAAPAIASPKAVELALSKRSTLDIAESLGIPLPRSLPASTVAEAEAAVGELGLPAVLKPVHQWKRDDEGGESAFLKPRLVETLEEVRHDAASMIGPDSPVLVQEMVTGGLFEHHQFFRHEGRVLAQITLAVDRQWPPFGISAMRTTVAPPDDTGPWAERLVAEIDIDGCSSVQFKRDEQGRARLMEVNARLVQTLAVAKLAGVDFARMQLEMARGGKIEPVKGYRLGVRVGWLSGDLHLVGASCHAIDTKPRPPRGTVKAVAADYLLGRARIEGFDLGDPRPMLASIGGAFSSVGRSIVGAER